ncbi:hypothetical protein [Portibacter lacus]|uniref:Uncharacterized protein n=1 Tax=Portibacter lacus TaxID=1099794 RepID=A0AA37WFX1_9BACT|nr:hypothetical protein [Portibacter lacus]GLR19182.1 hypothetical protein GCM10007940_37980 [Portibacter lacus]
MKLFRNSLGSNNQPSFEYLHEEDTDYESFIPWKNSFSGNNFFEWFRSKLSDFEENELQNDKNIFFFKNESTFAFRVNADVLNISPSIIWNYWKDEVLDIGYVLKNSETEYKDKENVQRYYLKPRLKHKVEKEQLYGNITLELLKNEAKPQYIMMKCTWYVDQNFKPARTYNDLLKILTN